MAATFLKFLPHYKLIWSHNDHNPFGNHHSAADYRWRPLDPNTDGSLGLFHGKALDYSSTPVTARTTAYSHPTDTDYDYGWSKDYDVENRPHTFSIWLSYTAYDQPYIDLQFDASGYHTVRTHPVIIKFM